MERSQTRKGSRHAPGGSVTRLVPTLRRTGFVERTNTVDHSSDGSTEDTVVTNTLRPRSSSLVSKSTSAMTKRQTSAGKGSKATAKKDAKASAKKGSRATRKKG